MTITAKIIADSMSPEGVRLTSISARYPRMIHSEFMTHRVFSRNASSSRAIPVERMIQDVMDDPAMPVEWGSNKPGMQAGDECTNLIKLSNSTTTITMTSEDAWLVARNQAVKIARAFAEAGYHKQVVNRLLEPFGHISVIVTATEWDNFFALRCHPDADPTMRALAEAMRAARNASTPQEDTWHLPYVSDDEIGELAQTHMGEFGFEFVAQISAARCARVSYLNHDGSAPNIVKDIALAKHLLYSGHMSPFEHQARVTDDEGTALWGNLNGWDQYRKMLESGLV